MRTREPHQRLHHQDRFNCLNNAYALIGYQTSRTYTDQTMGRMLNRRRHDLCAEIKLELQRNGVTVEDLKQNRFLRVNGQFTISVYLAPCRERTYRPNFWTVRLDRSIPLDLTVIARLQPGNCEMLDYLLLPDFEPLTQRLYLKEKPGKLEPYCFERLDVLPRLFKLHDCWKRHEGSDIVRRN